MAESQSAYGSQLRRWLLWGVAALFTVAGIFDWWFERHKEHRFDSQILQVSKQYGVDPALVKGVVWRESKFNPRARGRVGEIGLMQLRPMAAQEWAQASTRSSFDGNLLDPGTNLQVGAWYLSKLLKRYARTGDPVCYALADYNAGRSNVLRWNKGAAETNSAGFLSQMTFPARVHSHHQTAGGAVSRRVSTQNGQLTTDKSALAFFEPAIKLHPCPTLSVASVLRLSVCPSTLAASAIPDGCRADFRDGRFA